MALEVPGTGLQPVSLAHRLDKELKIKPGVAERSARAIRLKEELNLILELVVHSREALENELSSEFAQKKLSVDKAFIGKLSDLTRCYQALTASRIQLDKSERTMEAEMTPAQEKQAVRDFVASLGADERYDIIHEMWAAHRKVRKPNGLPSPEKLPGE